MGDVVKLVPRQVGWTKAETMVLAALADILANRKAYLHVEHGMGEGGDPFMTLHSDDAQTASLSITRVRKGPRDLYAALDQDGDAVIVSDRLTALLEQGFFPSDEDCRRWSEIKSAKAEIVEMGGLPDGL